MSIGHYLLFICMDIELYLANSIPKLSPSGNCAHTWSNIQRYFVIRYTDISDLSITVFAKIVTDSVILAYYM